MAASCESDGLPAEEATEVFTRNNTTVMVQLMNSNQFKKWLAEQGATFKSGKGGHLKVFLNGRRSVLPMHGSKEIGKGLEQKIKKDLDLQ